MNTANRGFGRMRQRRRHDSQPRNDFLDCAPYDYRSLFLSQQSLESRYNRRVSDALEHVERFKPDAEIAIFECIESSVEYAVPPQFVEGQQCASANFGITDRKSTRLN